MSLPDEYPRFRSVNVNLSLDPTEYEEIMHEIYVIKSKRYTLISDPKKYWDQKEAAAHVSFDVIDNGPS